VHRFIYNEEYGISSWTAGYESGVSEKLGLALKRMKNLHQKLLQVLKEKMLSVMWTTFLLLSLISLCVLKNRLYDLPSDVDGRRNFIKFFHKITLAE
jgi:hypothetical protein